MLGMAGWGKTPASRLQNKKGGHGGVQRKATRGGYGTGPAKKNPSVLNYDREREIANPAQMMC